MKWPHSHWQAGKKKEEKMIHASSCFKRTLHPFLVLPPALCPSPCSCLHCKFSVGKFVEPRNRLLGPKRDRLDTLAFLVARFKPRGAPPFNKKKERDDFFFLLLPYIIAYFLARAGGPTPGAGPFMHHRQL